MALINSYINATSTIMIKITLALAFLAASASAAMALISCSGTRTSFTFEGNQVKNRNCGSHQFQLPIDIILTNVISVGIPHLHPLHLHSPGCCALNQRVLGNNTHFINSNTNTSRTAQTQIDTCISFAMISLCERMSPKLRVPSTFLNVVAANNLAEAP